VNGESTARERLTVGKHSWFAHVGMANRNERFTGHALPTVRHSLFAVRNAFIAYAGGGRAFLDAFLIPGYRDTRRLSGRSRRFLANFREFLCLNILFAGCC
jgi:hypothetical protein